MGTEEPSREDPGLLPAPAETLSGSFFFKGSFHFKVGLGSLFHQSSLLGLRFVPVGV